MVVQRDTVSMEGRSVARFHPGLYVVVPLTARFDARSSSTSILPRASSSSDPVRMMPTRLCMVSCRACWMS